jgi:hypothetical protein
MGFLQDTQLDRADRAEQCSVVQGWELELELKLKLRVELDMGVKRNTE